MKDTETFKKKNTNGIIDLQQIRKIIASLLLEISNHRNYNWPVPTNQWTNQWTLRNESRENPYPF